MKIRLEESNERFDVALSKQYPNFSRAYLQKAIRNQWVQVVGQDGLKPSDEVKNGAWLEITGPFEKALSPQAELPNDSQSLDAWPKALLPQVLFEDVQLLILNKPAGLVVHPAPGHEGVTLIDWLKGYLPEANRQGFANPQRLGLVHRLDKDTTGVIVVAKTVQAQAALSQQFRKRDVQKTYNAWVEGVPKSSKGVIVAPVGRSKTDPKRMSIARDGRMAETTYQVDEALHAVSRLTLFPKTGRTHQLRVHCAALGHPIVGDVSYGSKPTWEAECGVHRPLLHAAQIHLKHPATGKALILKAPWPADFEEASKMFRKQFAMVFIGLLVSFSAYAAETGSAPKPTKKTTKSSGVSAEGSTTRALREIRASIDELKQVNVDLQARFDALDATRRFADLEKAIAELNGRIVGAQTIAEESKTQALDANRKAKTLQDTLDQFRDQVDRLQREVIQLKTQVTSRAVVETSTPAAEPVKRR